MGFHMRNFIQSFVRDESGAAAAEYALILAIIAIAIVGAMGILRDSVSQAITNAANQI